MVIVATWQKRLGAMANQLDDSIQPPVRPEQRALKKNIGIHEREGLLTPVDE